MANELIRLRKRKKAEAQVAKLSNDAEHTLVIHYSCESFYDIKDGKTPRITSIAIRGLDGEQTESFSIHKIAEREHVLPTDIPSKYDELEKEMLSEYFEYMRQHQKYTFVHWNMRDINYGFIAIEHRYQVLGGDPYKVPDDNKFNLAKAMSALYGNDYIGHGDKGRFLNLLKFNDITDKDALGGEEEALAFKSAEYIKLHQSTLRKVDCMACVFSRVAEDSLATNSTWLDRNGIHPKIIIDYIREHWLYSLVGMGLTVFGIVKLYQWSTQQGVTP